MSINKPPADRMMRPGDTINKRMSERVKVKIAKPFMYNGKMASVGDEVEMNEDKAFNHMKVGDVEKDQVLITQVRERRIAAADAAKKAATDEWEK